MFFFFQIIYIKLCIFVCFCVFFVYFCECLNLLELIILRELIKLNFYIYTLELGKLGEMLR